MSLGDSLRARSHPTRSWARPLLAAAILVTTGIVVAADGAPISVPARGQSSGSPYCPNLNSITVAGGPAAGSEIGALRTRTPASGPAGPPPPLVLALGQPTIRATGTFVCYNFSVDFAAPGLAVGETAFEVKTVQCGQVPGFLAIEWRSADGTRLAVEDLSSHGWGSEASATLSTGDSLVVISETPLVGDELVYSVSSPEGGTEGSMVVPGWTGASEGCAIT